MHDLQGGITENALFASVQNDTATTAALSPSSLVRNVG